MPPARRAVAWWVAAALVALTPLTACSTVGAVGGDPAPASSAQVPVSAPRAPMTAVTSAARVAGPPSATRTAAEPSSPGTALAALDHLLVKGRAPLTGYERAQFGAPWSDASGAQWSGNGCSTRDDVLRAELQQVRMLDECRVGSGTEIDPYTRVALYYVRGRSTVDIDHVVALGDAWQKGAQQMSRTQRIRFANDPLNLLAVSARANRQKGDADAASWLPANKRYRCAYVARQIAVKQTYRLWVTAAERDVMRRVLARCPAQRPPAEAAGRAERAPTPAPSTQASAAPRPSTTTSVYYQNCDAVRAAGAAPLHRGDPGYDDHLDRDGDGVACEP